MNFPITYRVKVPADQLTATVVSEIKRNPFRKNHDISGKVRESGQIQVYNTTSFVLFNPNFGPLIKLNFSCFNTNPKGTESTLELKLVHGSTYRYHRGFSLVFSFITFVAAMYQIVVSQGADFLALLLPLAGIGYFYFMKFMANASRDDLVSKIEKMLTKEGIKFEKATPTPSKVG